MYMYYRLRFLGLTSFLEAVEDDTVKMNCPTFFVMSGFWEVNRVVAFFLSVNVWKLWYVLVASLNSSFLIVKWASFWTYSNYEFFPLRVTGNFLYRPFSISRGWALTLILLTDDLISNLSSNNW